MIFGPGGTAAFFSGFGTGGTWDGGGVGVGVIGGACPKADVAPPMARVAAKVRVHSREMLALACDPTRLFSNPFCLVIARSLLCCVKEKFARVRTMNACVANGA